MHTKQHLIHIGFPRCGSTYLQRWFALHPQMHSKNMDFGGYAGAIDLCRAAANLDAFDFQYYVTTCEGLSLPFYGMGRDIVDLLNHAYSYPVPVSTIQERVCHTLADLFPGARILIVTRGFQSLMLSLYHQFVRIGYQQTLEEMCRNFVASGAAEYDAAIALYRSAFGHENVLLLPFELLREDETKFTRLLEEELGLDHTEIVLGAINASLTPLELHRCRKVFGAFGRLKPILGDARHRKLHNTLTRHSRTGKMDRVLNACRILTTTKVVENPVIPDDIVEMCRGKAESLRELPAYDRYIRDYLPFRAD